MLYFVLPPALIIQFLEYPADIGVVFQGLIVVLVENPDEFLDTLAELFDIGLILEIVDSPFLGSPILALKKKEPGIDFQEALEGSESLHEHLVVDDLIGLFEVHLHLFEEVGERLLEVSPDFGVGGLVQAHGVQVLEVVVDALDEHLPEVVLGVGYLAGQVDHDAVVLVGLDGDGHAVLLLGLVLDLLAEEDRPHPFVFQLLEGRLHLVELRDPVVRVPQVLVTAVQVQVL
jgi:hypothetical protein